jgi:hypothetical protein
MGETSNNRRDACWPHSQDGRAPINAASIVPAGLWVADVIRDPSAEALGYCRGWKTEEKTPNAECMSLTSDVRPPASAVAAATAAFGAVAGAGFDADQHGGGAACNVAARGWTLPGPIFWFSFCEIRI